MQYWKMRDRKMQDRKMQDRKMQDQKCIFSRPATATNKTKTDELNKSEK